MSACRRLLIAALVIQASALFAQSAGAVVLTDPVVLNPGTTISPVPDGFSGLDFTHIPGSPIRYSFDFSANSGPAGTLVLGIVQYPDIVTPAHPYGSDLMFNYRLFLSAGDVTGFTVFGYSGFDVSVKQCSFPGCFSVVDVNNPANSVSRTADGDAITFTFDGLGATHHTGNLSLFTNAPFVVDPLATFQNAAGGVFSIEIAGPSATPAVPEPSTWAMLLLGFAGLGLMAYRRKSKPALMVV